MADKRAPRIIVTGLLVSLVLLAVALVRFQDALPIPQGYGRLSGVVSFGGMPYCSPILNPLHYPPCSGIYPRYNVTVYKANTTEIAMSTFSDLLGRYSLVLPDGLYTIRMPSGLTDERYIMVDIADRATTRLDLNVYSGIQ